jgi:hypothetical protein
MLCVWSGVSEAEYHVVRIACLLSTSMQLLALRPGQRHCRAVPWNEACTEVGTGTMVTGNMC